MRFSDYGDTSRRYLADFASSFRDKISLVRKIRSYGPDLILSVNELPPSPFESILSIPSVVFVDTRLEQKRKKAILNHADKVIVPDCYHYDIPDEKELRHSSYHSLAYLHPDRFTPDRGVLERLKVNSKGYVVVSFEKEEKRKSSKEDFPQRREKIDLVRDLAEHCRVFIDGRGSIPPPLREHLPPIPLTKYNDLLAYADLVVGDDPEVSSDAGVLGTPWIYIGESSPSFLEDQEVHYEIGSQVDEIEDAKELSFLLLEGEIEPDFESSRKNILEDKIDLTGWMIELVKKYEEGF